MTDTIRSEYRKLLTTRTALGLFAGMVILTGLAVFGTARGAARADLAGGLSSSYGDAGVLIIATVFVLVLAIRSFTDEARYGSIVPTFLATPERRRVLLAKSAVAASASVVFAVSALVVATIVMSSYLAASAIPLAFSAATFAVLLARGVAIVGLWALIGVAIGAVVRHQVAAIVGTLAWLFVVENIVGSLIPTVARWLPAGAAGAAAGIPTPGMTAPMGFLALGGWAAVAMAAAAAAVARRDVV
jgi:ABC-2 type transport system permease protein